MDGTVQHAMSSLHTTTTDPAGPEPAAAPGRLAGAMVAAAVLPHVAGSLLLPPAWALAGTLGVQGLLLAAVAWLFARR